MRKFAVMSILALVIFSLIAPDCASGIYYTAVNTITEISNDEVFLQYGCLYDPIDHQCVETLANKDGSRRKIVGFVSCDSVLCKDMCASFKVEGAYYVVGCPSSRIKFDANKSMPYKYIE